MAQRDARLTRTHSQPSGMLQKFYCYPQSEIPLKPNSHRSSSSRFKLTNEEKIERLPTMSSVPDDQKQELFLKKIRQCRICFDFSKDDLDRVSEKEIKKDALLELVQYISELKTFSQSLYPEIIEMVKVNLFRPLSPRLNPIGVEFDPEEDEPILEAAWPHLQRVYEFFAKFIDSRCFVPRIAEPFIDKLFIDNLIDLFDAEDPRERDYAKTTLHRVYSSFFSQREYIRKIIAEIFITFVNETHNHNGITELLEVFVTIAEGFSVPLKPEHKIFLKTALLPLHKSENYGLFHSQISYCVTQYVTKEPDLTGTVIKVILKYWPNLNSTKEVLFLIELEQILEIMDSQNFLRIHKPLFKKLAQCIVSPKYQVVERVLSIWNNKYIFALMDVYMFLILPLILPSLYCTFKYHWHSGVRGFAMSFLALFKRRYKKDFENVFNNLRDQKAKILRHQQEKKKILPKDIPFPARSPQDLQDLIPDEDFQTIEKIFDQMKKYEHQQKNWRKSLLPLERQAVNAMYKHVSLEDDCDEYYSSDSSSISYSSDGESVVDSPYYS